MTQQAAWVAAFRDFCSQLKIDSKETGIGILAPNGKFGYGSQEQFLSEIDDGLKHGVHNFCILKSRQLGISTISIALDLFWALVHSGLQGGIICHDEPTRDDFRAKLLRYIDSLPENKKRGIDTKNRYRVQFANGSVLNFMIAGTRSKGTLGRAFGLNYLHATECSSYGDDEGMASLRNSLAEHYPHRLYIYESTARGFNGFHSMWEEAGEDPSQKRFFLGWYHRQDQSIPQTDPRFATYYSPPSPEEIDKLTQVKTETGMVITPEQMAWHRWKTSNDDWEGQQEQPWLADDAFVTSGSSFFPAKQVGDALKYHIHNDTQFKAYQYYLGDDFFATSCRPVYNSRDAELRIWEDPDPTGEYIIGADPTYGTSEKSNFGCIEVYRCYADKLVQVAEFGKRDIIPDQFAWIIAHLGGLYRKVMVNLEVNGPGEGTFQELRHLKQLLTQGKLTERVNGTGIEDIFDGVRYYYYHRQDSMGTQLAYFWKTQYENKKRILNQLRDSFQLNNLKVNSVPMLQEMRYVKYQEGNIGASSPHTDDRVMASALAHVGWTDWVRGRMITAGKTFEAEQSRLEQEKLAEGRLNFQQSVVTDYFRIKKEERHERDINAIPDYWNR